jgi:hypothetical protein
LEKLKLPGLVYLPGTEGQLTLPSLPIAGLGAQSLEEFLAENQLKELWS